MKRKIGGLDMTTDRVSFLRDQGQLPTRPNRPILPSSSAIFSTASAAFSSVAATFSAIAHAPFSSCCVSSRRRVHTIVDQENIANTTFLPRTRDEEDLHQLLNEWITQAPENLHNNYIQAATRIKICYAQKNPELNLSSLTLTSLPDRAFLFLTHLQTLHLNNNPFTTLPEGIFSSLTQLLAFSLCDTPLTSLPEGIFSSLTQLRILHLYGNLFTSLPEGIFSSLSQLQWLYLTDNHLTSLPEGVFSPLTKLQILHLAHNRFTSLPDQIFSSLRQLQELHLFNNQITSISGNLFSSLTQIQMIGLSNNYLSSLPLEIFSLAPHCTIDIACCRFTSSVQGRIRNTINTPEYQGPNILCARFLLSIKRPDPSFDTLIRKLYAQIDQSTPDLPIFALLQTTEKDSEQIRHWLAKLTLIAEFRNGGNDRIRLVKKIIEYLELAASPENECFRNEFLQIIDEASTTCGDRMALSIIHLGIAKRIATVSLDNMQNVYDLLIYGVWTIDQLFKIAHEKVQGLRFFDEIEVHLGFLIPLKEDLNIPLDVEEMLYFQLSSVSSEDLNRAREIILRRRGNPQEVCAFLNSQPLWNKMLEKIYPEEYESACKTEDPFTALQALTIRKLNDFAKSADLVGSAAYPT